MTDIEWKRLLPRKKITGVIGGPPCQGYSRIGKSDINDPRRSLVSHFFRNVNLIKPKFFVMENVEGLLDGNNCDELFKALTLVDKRYSILSPFVVDASKLGAPTARKRVIVVGYDKRYIRKISKEDFEFSEPVVCVRDAISDLPSPILQGKKIGDREFGWAKYKSNLGLSSYARVMRLAPQNLGSKFAIEQLRQGVISGNFSTTHNDKIKKRYFELSQGTTDNISRSKKLSWNGFCPTLRAGTGSDKGSYQAVRPIHPEEPRVITVREAARLQGFPDWFIFHQTKWHSFRMIGNSVSPIVSRKILDVIGKKIKSI